ncbi:DUF1285 domain-containing protein [Paraneptunicella aestuarii]|uniref:DUF1285 domain-containing protein n=1 Tax=Paraneptunicella aestuarii TaxID=2831148 RepID=UPI001E4C4A60|nr:DUF1285 domain-containing protein [Paraneptunicella aestuarii]UAA39261.1 DUF1285 domain-containing protein [Paraneptunicella aestuarii]
MDLASLQKQLQKQLQSQTGNAAPVHLWDPPFCGDIDLRIKHDGSWHYMGTPIGRPALVRLFASVLKKEDDKYFLVTPVEKVGIHVEDVPFVITSWKQQDNLIIFTTGQGEEFVVSEQNPVELRMDGKNDQPLPYVLVRSNLYARLHQNVYYQLVELGEERELANGEHHLMVNSGNYSFSLGLLD